MSKAKRTSLAASFALSRFSTALSKAHSNLGRRTTNPATSWMVVAQQGLKFLLACNRQRMRGDFGGNSYSSSVAPPHCRASPLAILRAR